MSDGVTEFRKLAKEYLTQLSEWRCEQRIPTRVEVDCLAKVIQGAAVNWLDALTTLLRAVANGHSGQVGTLMVGPPDIARRPVQLIAERGAIRLEGVPGFEPSVWKPEDAAVAVSAYVAAVEG
jgi:hypothetical protein